MQARVPQATAARGLVAQLSVGDLSVGPITVGRLEIGRLDLAVRAGSAHLENVVTTTTVTAWLWWDPPIFDPRTSRIGRVSLRFPVGDVDVPELRNIDLRVLSLVAPGVTVGVAPVSGVTANRVVAEDVRTRDVVLPTPPFALAGLGLAGVEVQDVTVPGAAVSNVSVRRVTGDPLALPALRLDGLALPAASSDDITTGALDIPLRRTEPIRIPRDEPLDLGLIRVQLILQVEVRTEVSRMSLTGVQVGASGGPIELRDVTLPYAATDLTLSDLGIETIQVPVIGVS